MSDTVYRVRVLTPEGTEPEWGWKPDGWDEAAALDNPRFASWSDSGDGYNEPRDPYVTTDHADGRPYFVVPRRRRYFSRSAAQRLAVALADWGLVAIVEKGLVERWELANQYERVDGQGRVVM